MLSKEPHILSKEPCILNPIFFQKSPIFSQKSPTFSQRTLPFYAHIQDLMHIYKILQILYTVLRLVSIQSLYPIFCAPFSIQLSSEVSHIYKICKITYTNPAVFAHIQDLYAHLHIYKICTDIQTYISENSPIFYQKSPILSQKSPVFSQKRSAFLFTRTRYAQIYVSKSQLSHITHHTGHELCPATYVSFAKELDKRDTFCKRDL